MGAFIVTDQEWEYAQFQKSISQPGVECAGCGADMLKPEYTIGRLAFCYGCHNDLPQCDMCDEKFIGEECGCEG